ncbi:MULTISPECIES: hypothetical protein [Bacillaceae]|uniref:Uncharacterized protein n=1 Tax=Evansella alkalicola TaxID=745819 RepID=A0ABS6JWX9_9BACI|nr:MULTISPECIES: hypothetical protein [Bacillaceae]MBU9721620.1 hypothetical protein [Bacillus alkalicola]
MDIITNRIVTKHVNIWDPEQLLEMGAPDDEYEMEIERITKKVPRCQDEIEVAEAILMIRLVRIFPLKIVLK